MATVVTETQNNTREVTMVHYDGVQRIVKVNDVEMPFPKGRLVISHTDLEGNITYVNRFLVDISGYKESELIGQPHRILRHPDMPPIIFQEMWETIQKGQIWEGGIKNLRKDGSFYWVYAVVTPNKRRGEIVGYISIRNELSAKKKLDCEKRYPTLFNTE